MHPLDELKQIVKMQKTVRTTRLVDIVNSLSKTIIGLNKQNIEQKNAYEKLQRDFQKVRHLADKRRQVAIDHEELKIAYKRLQEDKFHER